MTRISPFCPACAAFFPAGNVCPACKRGRPKLETPPEPGKPLWRVELPGAPALRPALAQVAGRTLLLFPWGNRDAGTGGVVALDTADGSTAWDARLDMPVEGGVAVAGSAGVAVVGLARRGHFSSEGAITGLDLRTGQECWPGRVQPGGAVEAAPVADDAHAYVAASDGQLYCVDVLSGRLVWKKPVVDKPVRIPASPALFIQRGSAQAIVVATYGVTQWQDDGKLVAFDAVGRRLWETPAGGQVRGAPVIVKGRVYVTAARGSPATGVLSVFDLRTGRAIWPGPFTIPAPPGGRSDIVAAPLVIGDTVYVGSHDHWLHAVDVATGVGRWSHEVPRGIVSTPASVEGLIVFGANDGVVYAADAATGARAWDYELGGHVQAGLLAWGDVVFAASDNGAVAALPWHAGRYAWAAERLEKVRRWSDAGDCRALAGHFGGKRADQEDGYRRAAANWYAAEAPELAAEMWTALSAREARWRKEAADAWHEAGLVRCGRDPVRAAIYLKRAAALYHKLRLGEPLNECTQAWADCARLPFLAMHVLNPGSFIQGEACELELRLTNEGVSSTVGSVWLELGGGLKQFVTATIPERLPPGGSWRVPLTVTPVQLHSTLQIEIAYDSGIAAQDTLRGLMVIPVDAVKQDRPINIGDIARLELHIGGATKEGIQIRTQDVGGIFARGGQIGEIHVQGDVGALVGMDPAVRQQVADLRNSVGWLSERMQRFEAAPPGPEPATGDDLKTLRAGLAGYQEFLTRLIASLAAEQRTAVIGIGVDIKLLTEKLEDLGRAQAEARRSQAQAALPTRPVDPATARWTRRLDEFAARIEVSDLRGFLSRGLVIEPGVCAIFLEEGRAEFGQVGPGHYALDTLLDRVPGMRGIRRTTAIILDAGEITLPFELTDLPTADGRHVTARAELCFRLADGMAFFVNYIKGQPQVLRNDLRDHLLPEVRDAAGEWVAPRPSGELSGNLVQKDALAAAVAEHLRETLIKLGLRFERVRALAFQSS